MFALRLKRLTVTHSPRNFNSFLPPTPPPQGFGSPSLSASWQQRHFDSQQNAKHESKFSRPPPSGLLLLMPFLGVTTTLCIFVVSVIAYGMYNLSLPQPHVPSCRNWGSSPLGSTSAPNTFRHQQITRGSSAEASQPELAWE